MIIKSIELGFENNIREHMTPSLIIKVGGCNMRCLEDETTVCQLSTAKIKSVSYMHAKKLLTDNPQIQQIVITGGEPLLYKTEIEKMLNEIYVDGMNVVIKTNGTMTMLNPLGKNYKIGLYDVYVPSEKFPIPGVDYNGVIYGTNEVDNMLNKHIDIDNLLNIAMYAKDYVFNFEASTQEQLENVDEIINKLYARACVDDFTNNLFKKYPIEQHIAIYASEGPIERIKEICLQRGWNVSAKQCNKI